GTGDHGGTATGPHRWGCLLDQAKTPDAGGAASPRTAWQRTRPGQRRAHPTWQRSLRSIKHHLPPQWVQGGQGVAASTSRGLTHPGNGGRQPGPKSGQRSDANLDGLDSALVRLGSILLADVVKIDCCFLISLSN